MFWDKRQGTFYCPLSGFMIALVLVLILIISRADVAGSLYLYSFLPVV
ncbi:Uncharacterised protein [Sphingobacterium spiritivorum]|nr:Uncharacterised protein [Sphingobacterium spiritivorum]